MNKLFKKYSTTKKTKYGFECECVKCLWSASAPTRQQAIDMGYYYFLQYYYGGEYDEDGGLSRLTESLNNETS